MQLLGEAEMALWFTGQTSILISTLEEGFFDLIYNLREEKLGEIVDGNRDCLTKWACLPLPKSYHS